MILFSRKHPEATAILLAGVALQIRSQSRVACAHTRFDCEERHFKVCSTRGSLRMPGIAAPYAF